MSYVVTLTNAAPAPRFDGLPYTQVRIDEAPDSTGPFTTIDVQNLVPVDANPAAPQARNITTTHAVLSQGWYRLAFLDGLGNIEVTASVAHYPPSAGDPSPDDALGPVTATNDLRVLIPRARRAVDGPRALSSQAVASSYTDSEILAAVADATAEVILLTGGSSVFGYQLLATHRDPFYLAPDQWVTDRDLSPEAQDVVIAQTAINVHLHRLREAPYVSEEITDEGQGWKWEKSANLLLAQLKLLADIRDRSLELLRAMNAPLDAYFSTMAERDRLAAAYLEPYVAEIGAGVPYAGLSGVYVGGYDWRFGTVG